MLEGNARLEQDGSNVVDMLKEKQVLKRDFSMFATGLMFS